jgi:membrane glycosyltransferase
LDVAQRYFLAGNGVPRRSAGSRRSVAIAASLAFSVFVLWFSTAGFSAALSWLQVLGAGVFLVLLSAGTFNLFLYVVGYVQRFDLTFGSSGLVPAGTAASAAWRTPAIRTRTAVVMPIYHEDTERVAAGIRETWRSCKTCGLDHHCDWYLLCDSTDAETCRQEEQIVQELLPEFGFNGGPMGRLLLVRRPDRKNFKAGNIMNFLDQHGDAYDFMLVLDADSVMLGQSIERLILTLQEHPRIGILQTLMLPIRSATPFARAMQYSTARCLPLYAKGMRWFYDRDSVYWGHNALIRVAPFREHCRLPTLPGKPPLGGTIMSQDIVEAAFMGRAGWEVGWLIDGGGSFDELPANILTYGQRDRRWCQGNFQHYRFILAPGIRFGHRFYFANGIFSYLASPLLLFLILLGLLQACLGAIPTLDPWLLRASMGLFWFQVLTPRVLGLIHFARQRSGNVQRPLSMNLGSRDNPLTPSLSPSEGERVPFRAGEGLTSPMRERLVGGVLTPSLFPSEVERVPGWRSRDTPRTSWRWLWREAASTLAELVLSLLMGPLLFYLHTRFVAEILSGGQVAWRNQSRNPGEGVSWASAARVFWLPTLLGLLGVVGAYRVGFPLALFILPVTLCWLLSIPLAVLTSDATLGEWLVKAGFFPDTLTAEEVEHLGPLARQVHHPPPLGTD